MPGLVREQQAIGVAVKGQARVRAHFAHRPRHHLGMGGPAAGIDIDAVRRAVEREHLRAQIAEERRGDVGDRAVRAIDDQAQPRQPARCQPAHNIEVALGGVALG